MASHTEYNPDNHVNDNASDHMAKEKTGVTMIESIENSGELDTIEETKPGAFVWLCAAATAIGGL